MIIYRTQHLTAATVQDKHGADAVRVEVKLSTLFKGILDRTAETDLDPAEAATLGAALLGFAMNQGGVGKDYARSVVEQMSWRVNE